MANASLRQQVEQVLDALPETATLEDLLCALEILAEEAQGFDFAATPDDTPETPTREVLGLRDTCATRRRRAADES